MAERQMAFRSPRQALRSGSQDSFVDGEYFDPAFEFDAPMFCDLAQEKDPFAEQLHDDPWFGETHAQHFPQSPRPPRKLARTESSAENDKENDEEANKEIEKDLASSNDTSLAKKQREARMHTIFEPFPGGQSPAFTPTVAVSSCHKIEGSGDENHHSEMIVPQLLTGLSLPTIKQCVFNLPEGTNLFEESSSSDNSIPGALQSSVGQRRKRVSSDWTTAKDEDYALPVLEKSEEQQHGSDAPAAAAGLRSPPRRVALGTPSRIRGSIDEPCTDGDFALAVSVPKEEQPARGLASPSGLRSPAIRVAVRTPRRVCAGNEASGGKDNGLRSGTWHSASSPCLVGERQPLRRSKTLHSEAIRRVLVCAQDDTDDAAQALDTLILDSPLRRSSARLESPSRRSVVNPSPQQPRRRFMSKGAVRLAGGQVAATKPLSGSGIPVGAAIVARRIISDGSVRREERSTSRLRRQQSVDLGYGGAASRSSRSTPHSPHPVRKGRSYTVANMSVPAACKSRLHLGAAANLRKEGEPSDSRSRCVLARERATSESAAGEDEDADRTEILAMLSEFNEKFRAPKYVPRIHKNKWYKEWEHRTGERWEELPPKEREKWNREITQLLEKNKE